LPPGSLETPKVCSPSFASQPRRTQTSRRSPWKRPLPRKPPCAQGPYVAPAWSCGPSSLRMRALSLFVSERPWQLFGLFVKWERDDPTASCGLFGPGPEPVCRVRTVDSTTANKIQGSKRLAAGSTLALAVHSPTRLALPRSSKPADTNSGLVRTNVNLEPSGAMN
jgi:hypothetical protein